MNQLVDQVARASLAGSAYIINFERFGFVFQDLRGYIKTQLREEDL